MLSRIINFCLLMLILLAPVGTLKAQTRPTATPVPAVLFTPTPDNAPVVLPTATPLPSPTPLAEARLQALDTAGNVNVRALPDVESEIQGTIAYGAEYPVLRQYFRWYELLYDPAPSGRAWVYGDLVTIAGDTARIQVIDNPAAIALGGEASGAQDEADERTIEIATVTADSAQSIELVGAAPLPTFTYAPTRSPASDRLSDEIRNEPGDRALPPIIPILILGGLGVLGLLISLIRS